MRRRHKLRVQWFWWLFKWLFDIRRRVIWSDVCTGGGDPTSKLAMRESMGGDVFQGGRGEGGLALISSLCEGDIFHQFPKPPSPGDYCTIPKPLISLIPFNLQHLHCFQGKGHCYVAIPIVFPANQKQSFKLVRDQKRQNLRGCRCKYLNTYIPLMT